MGVPKIGFQLQSNYQASRAGLEKSMTRLSSGDRLSTVGDASAADLSISERLRHRMSMMKASYNNIERARIYIQNTEFETEQIAEMIGRMSELAALGTDPLLTSADRSSLDAEYGHLLSGIGTLARNSTFYDTQTIGREVMVSYETTENKLKFFPGTGSQTDVLERDFGANDKDIDGTFLGFSSNEDFTMSRDGRSLFYVGTDTAGDYYLKRYDIENQQVSSSTTAVSSGDNLFVDETGGLYLSRVNPAAPGDGALYQVNTGSLSLTAVAGVTDMVASEDFSVFENKVTYRSTGGTNPILQYDLVALTSSTLVADASTLSTPAVDHSYSASGRYIAEESAADTIRVLDTSNGNVNTIAISTGAGNAVNDLRFSEDGDRIFFINKDRNRIESVSVNTDSAGAVNLSFDGTVVSGVINEAFDGLDLGGVNPFSKVEFAATHGSVNMLSYEAVDLRPYTLGIVNTDLTTQANANTAMTALVTAKDRLNSQRAVLSAQGIRFTTQLNLNLETFSHVSEAEGFVRNTDVAKEAAEMSKFQIMNQGAIAVLSQYNTMSQNVLSLLQ